MMSEINELELARQILADGEMFLVGIGSGLEKKKENADEIDAVYATLSSWLKGKNYFVLTGNTDGKLLDGTFYPRLVCAPNLPDQEKNWNGYMNWLTGTLGHRLVILELEEGFLQPQLMRWPFERTVMINQKASLIRACRSFPQVPAELKNQAVSLAMDAGRFVQEELR